MRSDVRIGIAIGLVIILGVVIYFIFIGTGNTGSNNATVERGTSGTPTGPHKIRLVKGSGASDKPGEAATVGETSVAGIGDSAGKTEAGKVDAARTDAGKVDVALVGGGKTDVAKIDEGAKGPGKGAAAVGGADIWSVTPPHREKTDPVEEKMRKEYEGTDGEVSMRPGGEVGAGEVGKGVDNVGVEAGKAIEVALVGGASKGNGLKAMGKDEPVKTDAGKADVIKIGGDSDPLRSSLEAADANKAKAGDAVSKGQYSVESDDSTGSWGIAGKVYGNKRLYYLIEKANLGVDWRRLQKGQVLKILPAPAPPVKGNGGDRPLAGNGGKPGTTTTADERGYRKYTVRKGDNGFADIAKKVYGDGAQWGLIESANVGVDSKRLRENMVLTIPPLEKKKAGDGGLGGLGGLGGVGGPPDGKPGGKYAVRKGDNGFADIAKKVYGDGRLWPAIEKANPNVESKRLKDGMVLTLPSEEEARKLVGLKGNGGASGGSPKPRKTTGKTTGGSPRGADVFD